MSMGSSAGHAIVRALEAHGVDRVFQVPGESFLDVLDGLHDSGIDTVVCRHEAGPPTRRRRTASSPGGPGSRWSPAVPGRPTLIGVHEAWQDGTPLVLFVGLVPTRQPPA